MSDIEGVVVKEIETHADERGFFREIVRFDDLEISAKQESHAFRIAGVANGWHIHRFHRETFYVVSGTLRLCLKDCRIGQKIQVSYPYDGGVVKNVNFGLSSTPDGYQEVIMSGLTPRMVSVPAGVAHGYVVLQDANIVYTATATYETSRHDEGRIAWDQWANHQWTRGIEIK